MPAERRASPGDAGGNMGAATIVVSHGKKSGAAAELPEDCPRQLRLTLSVRVCDAYVRG